jgi:hypothetical protein
MIEYFELEGSPSRHLSATDVVENPNELTLCSVTSGWNQHRSSRRVADLKLEVKHNLHDQRIIAALCQGLVMHVSVLEKFERRKITGYRLRPATVRFRDGSISRDYSQLMVTGWAGIAPPESGIELIEACGECGYKRYSALKHPEHLIDRSQWSGEDFFMVWPLPNYIMITKRVAGVLAELKVKSYQLKDPRRLKQAYSFGYTVGPLSQFLPEDLAMKYGGTLGLQCESGFYPAVDRSSSEKKPELPKFHHTPAPSEKIAERIRTGEPANRTAEIASLFALEDAHDLSQECLALLEKGDLKAEEAAPHTPRLLAIWNSAYQKLKPKQQQAVSNEWLTEDEYAEARALGEVMLDVLGYLPGEDVDRALNDGMTLTDPRLKTFAILSLLRRGQCVDPDQIEQAAASLEMRKTFHGQLRKLGCEWLMPEEWSQPWHLAASDLCRWASHPNELGVAPEEVEPMTTFQLEPRSEVYLFRFREYPKPWEPGEGWMAGIAGPFEDGESQGSPWSSFKRWDSMTPQQHFMKLYYRGSSCGT